MDCYRNAPFQNSWYTFGPRFFDTPLNEGTFWKGLAAAKYTAVLSEYYLFNKNTWYYLLLLSGSVHYAGDSFIGNSSVEDV